ncbi:hypothetical protein KBZ20_14295 [Vulcanococcus limneticus Candia 3F8]|uniref:hypothetical protein n=1 Tax=Vulcanococcus limneticus TaxID=2170428 RepID=UPI000B992A79|nr:hypothetical protein [Vulcanococcus limneticus]MCP9793573.1 hypothetical protein [Vulcanococcus limneticus MW73D5]MCP9894942.1 hypothetical protein [Vulcanococcus limneticus Candia 3F8]MCP9898930.1 hypothetical protein [Vulcanococcus limneticus Candia 3B3]
MPFNDKGEFIRPEPSGPSPGRRSRRRRVVPSQPPMRPPGRPRITTGPDARPPPRAAAPADSTSPWEAIAALIGLVLLLAALAGVGWVLLLFHKWILIALVLWALHGVSNWLR